MGMIKTAANGVAWTTISTFIRSVVSLLQIAVLTRFLEKSDFGIVAMATLFIGFSNIFLDLGLSVGIMHKQDTTREQYSSLFWINIFSGVFLTLILTVLSPLVANYYDEPSLTKILEFLSLSLFFSSLGNQHRTIQQKKMRFKFISLVEITTSLLTLIVTVLLAINGAGVYSLVYSTLFNVFLSNIIFLIYGIKKDKNVSFHFCLKDTYPFVKIGVYSLGTQILDYFSREMDVVIISSTLGKDVLGVYSLCKKIIMAVYNSINPILMKVMTPMLANIQKDKNKIKHVYYDIVHALAFVNYPIYCLIAIFSFVILYVLYGSTYTDSYHVLSLLSLYYGLLTTGSPVGALQTALGRTDTGFYWTICRIVIYSITVFIGALYNIEMILFLLIIVNILIAPLSWRITLKPLLQGYFWEYYKLRLLPYLLAFSISIPFLIIFKGVNNVFICIIIGLVYLFTYIRVVLYFYKNSHFVLFAKDCISTLFIKFKYQK